MKLLGLAPEWAIFMDVLRDLNIGQTYSSSKKIGDMDVFKINGDDDDR